MTHVAWNCDGKKLAAVGIDKVTRVWPPEKIVSRTDFAMLEQDRNMCILRPRCDLLLCFLAAMWTTSTTYLGILPTQSCSVRQVRETEK
jgi:hypothetical protein